MGREPSRGDRFDRGPVLRAGEVLELEQEARFWNGAAYRTRPRASGEREQ